MRQFIKISSYSFWQRPHDKKVESYYYFLPYYILSGLFFTYNWGWIIHISYFKYKNMEEQFDYNRWQFPCHLPLSLQWKTEWIFSIRKLYIFFTVATSRYFAQQRKTDTIFKEEKLLILHKPCSEAESNVVFLLKTMHFAYC